ncbi:LacI family DNA-binding transcriptional regulator [Cohaesibacter sp. CAU 1516]|uniref:LacI family DNA-binding transcriptional regulator n=1 Tax=Cohaesibacter sp. CAU 1516 TaxID=2576038 RepID=UPI0010FF350A|nr:LacI family DNA-binding transcriptional regulator [Cohaesibacter sp. CAU 1516]TLP46142.1 LacI family DNA-binding transcriptional regulator [Cohaesibacter sp. CAU 1516]
MKRTPKSTIYDIAEKAEASPSTVSAALNGTWKNRRIRQETAERIIAIAREFGYSANLQARGLRTARSGLVALLMPDYNRFFSSLAESFSLRVRQNGLCPVIVSTDRDREEELSTVENLASYNIDALFVVGASNPEDISHYCQQAHISHVFIDQPCKLAPSVVTDHAAGARALTREILRSRVPLGALERDRPYFIGGDANLPATALRIEGFCRIVSERLGDCRKDQINACGYELDNAELEIKRLYERLGGLPSALFINSLTVFEGILRFLITIPEEEIRACSLGCFDYEPFGSLLRFPVHMIRQRHKELIDQAFQLLDEGSAPGTLIEVKPQLYRAMDAAPHRLDE